MTGLFEKGQKLVITSLAAIKRGIRGLPPLTRCVWLPKACLANKRKNPILDEANERN